MQIVRMRCKCERVELDLHHLACVTFYIQYMSYDFVWAASAADTDCLLQDLGFAPEEHPPICRCCIVCMLRAHGYDIFPVHLVRRKDTQLVASRTDRTCLSSEPLLAVSSCELRSTAHSVVSSSASGRRDQKADTISLNFVSKRRAGRNILLPPTPSGRCSGGVWHYSNELRGLGPRANYTDRATTACRRS
jgi:hypothetical protein